MKKILMLAVAACFAMLTGCKSVPTTEEMYNASRSIGYAAGMVANELKIDANVRNAVIDVMNIAVSCVPETNQTFEAAWTPIAKAKVDELVKDGKLTEPQGVLVMGAFGVAVKGLDYVFEVRYPKAKPYKELASAAIDGFAGAFLDVFKPANVLTAKAAVESKPVAASYDKDAYAWLKKQCGK